MILWLCWCHHFELEFWIKHLSWYSDYDDIVTIFGVMVTSQALNIIYWLREYISIICINCWVSWASHDASFDACYKVTFLSLPSSGSISTTSLDTFSTTCHFFYHFSLLFSSSTLFLVYLENIRNYIVYSIFYM